jgi:hypothetical protein
MEDSYLALRDAAEGRAAKGQFCVAAMNAELCGIFPGPNARLGFDFTWKSMEHLSRPVRDDLDLFRWHPVYRGL